MTHLLNNEANMNIKDTIGYTPLMYVIENGESDIVKLLLENNADRNRTDIT